MQYNVKSVTPLHDFILVKRMKQPNKTPGGIYLAPTQEEQEFARVIAVGPGREGVPGTSPSVDQGDVIILARFIGTKVMMNGSEHLLVKWYDIQAIVETEGDLEDE